MTARVASRPSFDMATNGIRPQQQQSQNPFAGMSAYQQQQMMAMYQQQQLELAQQQAHLELQLKLEQMRLQNLALQEQIMLGQAAQAQAQAQAQAELHQRHGLPQKPASGGNRFAQGSVLAERALARRQAQWEAAQNGQDETGDEATGVDQVSPLRRLSQTTVQQQQKTPAAAVAGHHRRTSSTASFLSSPHSPIDPHSSTPALVLSKPGESYPTPANVSPTLVATRKVSHQHTDSGSSASTQSSFSSLLQSDRSGNDTPASEVASFDQKLAAAAKDNQSSPIVAAQVRRGSKESNGSSPKTDSSPKLNPFSSVFVPGGAAANVTSTPPIAKVTSAPMSASPPGSSWGVGGNGLYRARTGTPPSNGSPATRPSRGLLPASGPTGSTVVRQPKGPPTHEAELEAQNFNSRIRRRAIEAIKTLGVRVPASPTLSQHGGGFGGKLDAEAPAFNVPMVSPGLAALMAATRARRVSAEGGR